MDNSIAIQAKVALTNFYHWVVGQSQSFSTKPSSHATHQHIHYHHPYHPYLSEQQIPHSTSTSCRIGGQQDGHAPSFCHWSNIDGLSDNIFKKFFQTITGGNCNWATWDPVASFDSFLWNYTPDLRALQMKLLGPNTAVGEFVEKYNIEPRILVLVSVLPLVLLILTICVFMGAGHGAEEPKPPARVMNPALVSGKKSSTSRKKGKHHKNRGKLSAGSLSAHKDKNQAIANQYLIGNNNGISSWSAFLGTMGFFGGEILDYKPLDIFALTSRKSKVDAKTAHSHEGILESVIESVSALGSEMIKQMPTTHFLDHDIAQLLGSDLVESDTSVDEAKPPNNLNKAMNEPVDSANHLKAKAGSKVKKIPQVTNEDVLDDKEDTRKSPAMTDSIDGTADDIVATKEPMAATEPNSHRKPIKLSSFVPHIATSFEYGNHNQVSDQHSQQQEENSGHQSKHGPVTPSKDNSIKTNVSSIPPLLRTRTPRPSGSVRESDRSKGSHSDATNSSNKAVSATGNVGRDIGSKIFGFVQESQLLKNMDFLSGGLLGSAVATVAALASSAEATAGVIKNNLPDSVNDFADDLRESIDHAMKTKMENASEKSKKTRGVKNAINKIMQDDDENVASVSSNKSESLKSSTPATIRAPVPSSTSAPKSKNSSTLKPNDDMTSDSNSDVMDTQVHAEHEDEGYFLGHEEDSGEDSDVDNARENSDEEEDAGIYMNGNDTDDIFEQCTDDNQLDIDEPISSHTRLQEKTFESIHPHEQTAERDTSSSGGSIADDESPMKSTTTGPETQSHMQEMTVDDHGNKVPINNTEARRDSGYDLLH